MSELGTIKINQPDEFDRAVHGDDRVPALPSGDVIEIITKDAAMATHPKRGAAVITWLVEVDGNIRRAQYTVPIRLLKSMLRAIDAGYDDDGMPRPGTFGR